MTKKEFIAICNKFGAEIDDLELLIVNFKETTSNIRSLIDDLPYEESDIDNDKEEVSEE